MRLISTLIKLVVVLAVLAVTLPAAILGGLWVWLKLTEEADESAVAGEQNAG